MLLSVSVKSAPPCGPATECRPVGESRFPLQISNLNSRLPLKMHKHRLYAGIAQLVEHDLAKVGVASSNLVSRSKFSHIKKIQNNVVVSMRPLSGAATECRPVSESRFPLQIFTHRILNLNDELCSREPSVAREPLLKSRALIKGEFNADRVF